MLCFDRWHLFFHPLIYASGWQSLLLVCFLFQFRLSLSDSRPICCHLVLGTGKVSGPRTAFLFLGKLHNGYSHSISKKCQYSIKVCPKDCDSLFWYYKYAWHNKYIQVNCCRLNNLMGILSLKITSKLSTGPAQGKNINIPFTWKVLVSL